VQELMNLVNNDPALSRRGAAYDLELGLTIGEENFLFEISNGKLTSLHENSERQADHGFTLNAPRESWSRFCQPLPPPEYHDIFAMLSCGHMSLTGDTNLLMSNLLYVTGFLNHCKKVLTLENQP
jgi:hypothetical protein